MTKLSDLIQLPIKVDVSGLTEEERKELQLKLFQFGVVWGSGKAEVLQYSFEYLYVKQYGFDIHLTQSIGSHHFFESKNITEIKVEKLKEILGMNQKQFTKADLKDGMVVLLRGSDDRHLVLNNRFVAYKGWMDFDSYDNNLLEKCFQNNEFDVMEVFEVTNLASPTIQHWQLKSIWKREEKSAAQIEIEQIQKQVDELNARLETLKGNV